MCTPTNTHPSHRQTVCVCSHRTHQNWVLVFYFYISLQLTSSYFLHTFSLCHTLLDFNKSHSVLSLSTESCQFLKILFKYLFSHLLQTFFFKVQFVEITIRRWDKDLYSDLELTLQHQWTTHKCTYADRSWPSSSVCWWMCMWLYQVLRVQLSKSHGHMTSTAV